MSDTSSQKKTSSSKPEIKDYTLKLPMFDLGEAVVLVTEIHEKALETAAMPAVAASFGYASPSSTPFYRRVVAARLFGLLAAEGAALTHRAMDYLKPETDEAKDHSLRSAILGIQAFDDLVQVNQGKRLNPEIIGNGFMRKFAISQPAAAICAKAFIGSLKFAGFLEDDGSLKRFSSTATPSGNDEQPVEDTNKKLSAGVPEMFTDQEEHHLFLDKEKTRKFTINSPLFLSRAEYDRICKWIKVALIVEDDGKENP